MKYQCRVKLKLVKIIVVSILIHWTHQCLTVLLQDLSQYVVKGSERDWEAALVGGKTVSTLSLKTGEKRPGDDGEEAVEAKHKKKKKENQQPEFDSKKKKKKSKQHNK